MYHSGVNTPRRMKKKPAQKKLNAGSLKYLRSTSGPGSRGGRRLRRIRLQKIRIGRLMNATNRAAQSKPRDGLSMMAEMMMGHIYMSDGHGGKNTNPPREDPATMIPIAIARRLRK